MNTMKWLLKREYWEHKGGFFWAPVVVSGILGLLTIGSMLFAVIFGREGGFRQLARAPLKTISVPSPE